MDSERQLTENGVQFSVCAINQNLEVVYANTQLREDLGLEPDAPLAFYYLMQEAEVDPAVVRREIFYLMNAPRGAQVSRIERRGEGELWYVGARRETAIDGAELVSYHWFRVDSMRGAIDHYLTDEVEKKTAPKSR